MKDKQEKVPLPAQLYTAEAEASAAKSKSELEIKDPANASEAIENLFNEVTT